MYDLNQILSTAQTNLAKPTENQLAKAKYYGYTDEQVNQEMNKLQPNSPTPPVSPTPVAPQPTVQPAPQVAGTTTQAPQPELKPTWITTPQAQVESDILPPSVTGYVNPNQAKLEQANLNKFNSNLSLYSTGKSLYDAVQWGSLLPWTKEFTDLTTRNPQVLAEYNQIKTDKDKIDTVNTLGKAILWETITPKPSNALEQLVSFFTKSMDTDVASEYQNSVINNPAYQASIQAMNGINQQIADNNKNINALRDDVRKKYSAWTPESLIASAIAREARPLIEQGQYLSELQKNAQSEMTRLFEENKQVFDLKQEERNTNNQRMIDLYGTIRQEEIRQEDFARADQKLADEIARADKKDQATLDRLEQERMDNVKTALAQLGVDPTGETYDDLLSEYATAVKNQPTEDKITTGLKAGDSYLVNGELRTVPSQWQAWNPQNIAQYSIDKRGRANLQCGELVNDYWEMATGSKMGVADSYDSKVKAINKVWASPVPVEWGIFAFPAETFWGNTGHIGIVQIINEDGSITALEANRSGKKTGTEPQLNTYTAEQVKKMKFSQPPATPLDSNQRIIANTEKSAFRSNPVVKSFEEWLQQYQDIVVSLSDESWPWDTAGIFQFMKSLDPQSVVRETEFESAAKSAGVASYIWNTYDRVMKGKKLTPEQAIAFKRLAKAYVDNRATNYNRLYDDMARSMTNQGIHESYLPTRATSTLEKEQEQTWYDQWVQDTITEKLKTSKKEDIVKYLISKGIDPSQYKFTTLTINRV